MSYLDELIEQNMSYPEFREAYLLARERRFEDWLMGTGQVTFSCDPVHGLCGDVWLIQNDLGLSWMKGPGGAVVLLPGTTATDEDYRAYFEQIKQEIHSREAT